MPHYSPPLPFRRGRAGARACGPARGAPVGRGLARCVVCPGPRPGSRWPAGARPARGSLTSAARLRTGGEEESPRTGDSNPGCNCLVRGYSPIMHFFWGGDMPHYSPPLPFRRGRAGARACGPARGRPAQGSRSCALCGVPRPAPRVALEGGHVPGAGVADVRGTVEDGRGGLIPPYGGFQSRL